MFWSSGNATSEGGVSGTMLSASQRAPHGTTGPPKRSGLYETTGRYTVRAAEQRAWHALSASSIVWPLVLSCPAGGIAKHVAFSSGGGAPPAHDGTSPHSFSGPWQSLHDAGRVPLTTS
eukprot:scaffold49234_cov72-Phaeocystis_antarctica.AAC.2